MSSTKAQELVKLYYRIGEVSRIVGVQPHVLRYWESEFRTIRPQKSSKGQRVYSRRDVEKLLLVKDLLKNQGFTIAGARKQLNRRGSESAAVEPEVAPAAPAATTGARSSRTPNVKDAKGLRRALVQLRSEILSMMDELSAASEQEDAVVYVEPTRVEGSQRGGASRPQR